MSVTQGEFVNTLLIPGLSQCNFSSVATLAVLGFTSLAVGFRYGRLSTTASIDSSIAHSRELEESDDEEDAQANIDLSVVKPSTSEQCKLVAWPLALTYARLTRFRSYACAQISK